MEEGGKERHPCPGPFVLPGSEGRSLPALPRAKYTIFLQNLTGLAPAKGRRAPLPPPQIITT